MLNENQVSLVRIGSRGSDLALWQSNYVRKLLKARWPGVQIEIDIYTTKGDQQLDRPLPEIGGKGLFTAELEEALRDNRIDAAVHSLKDLPTDSPAGLTIVAVPVREDPADVLVSRGGYTLESLPDGASVGTSSLRRAGQLLRLRPDVKIIDIRGNLDTRIKKAMEPTGPYDAVILARAGLARLGLVEAISHVFSVEEMLPAPGQGALAIQSRDDWAAHELLSSLNDPDAAATTTAERAFLAGLGGGCSVPIGALATINDGQLSVKCRVTDVTGSRVVEVECSGARDEAENLGLQAAEEALRRGARELLEGIA